MTVEIKIIPAVIGYVLYLAGVVAVAISPALQGQGWMIASVVLALGLALGMLASHDFTNLSLLKNWSVSLTLTDIALGVVITGLSALAGFYSAQIYADY